MNAPLWWLTTDQDLDCLALYERHYSCYRYQDGRRRWQFLGPGEKVVLRTNAGDAMFAWRNFIDIIRATGCETRALRTTKDGSPEHPLYIPASTTPVPFPEG